MVRRGYKMKKWITSVVLLGVCVLGNAQTAKIDPKLLELTNCKSSNLMAPAEATFRVMEMSKSLTRTKVGEVTVYASLPDTSGGFMKVHGIVPSRLGVIVKNQVPFAVVGTIFEKEAPIKDLEILQAFAKGLGKDFVMTEMTSPVLKGFPGFVGAAMSNVAVGPNDSYLLMIKTDKGNRSVFCAPKVMWNKILF